MAALLDKIETPCLRRLYAYWDERRQGREFPARRDLDPLDFRYVLGHVLLLDVLAEPLRFRFRFRFRLHGSLLAERAGYDMTGKMIDELPNPANRQMLIDRCRALVEGRQAVAVIDERILGRRRFGYEAVWLPLAQDGCTIDMLMAGLVYRDSRDAGPLDWQSESDA
ncbi:MAG TPA: PAS domain-containing protein [Stellaceae bacterium]|nr:PAS domain-containing protein [Stellaceae bacterium]